MNRISILPSSRSWLTAALDPFHDFQYDLDGLPDERAAPSVVQLHNQTYELTAPVCAAGLWDASVTYTGLSNGIGTALNVEGALATQAIHNYDHAGLSTGADFGALTIRATTTGADLLVGSPVLANSTAVCLGDVIASAATSYRVIGVAIEITNTTAEIYKQGSVCVAMLPDVASDTGLVSYVDVNAAPWDNTQFQYDKLAIFPTMASQLRVVPGANTWAAKEGVYMIPRMTKVPRNISSLSNNNRVPQFEEWITGGWRGFSRPTPDGNFTDAATVIPKVTASAVTGFTPMQAIFTGLSHETTLTVNFRTIVEYFPPIMSDLLPLAHPSAAYDPLAFEIYSRIVATAPYAVPVSQNAAGDYFRKILMIMKTLGPAAGAALSSVFPLAGPVGSLVGDVSGYVLSRLPESTKKPPPKGVAFAPPRKPLPPTPARVARKEAGAKARQTRR